MGNKLISYFTQSPAEVGGDQEDTISEDDKCALSATTPTVPVEPLTDKQCVAWEIDVSDWKPHGKSSNKSKRSRLNAKSNYLREKHNNTLVGGARDVTEAKPERKLVKVALPTVQAEVKMAQYCDDMKEKKVLDLRRWYCMSRPQYQRSCGISSVVSCWNYLFSTLGSGCHRPITQEEALAVLGFTQPFDEIKFGPFSGNVTIMKWFRQLCDHYGVAGKAYYFYKLHGRGRTCGLTSNTALERFKEGLQDDSMAFIYHCYNHYFCPIGYEEVAKRPENAYHINLGPSQYDTWILIGEPNRKRTGIHWKRWQDVHKDLNCQNPEYFNIRHTEKGIQTRKTKKRGGNIHCIMALTSVEQNRVNDKENDELLSYKKFDDNDVI